MSIKIIELPYPKDALEPHISKKTMQVHYEKHYKKYISTLNTLISGSRLDSLTLENIILETFQDDSAIFNNAAQAWNHAFFWNCMSPNKTKPSSMVLEAINQQFGSLQEFRDHFFTTATKLFGSGWVWLVKRSDGTLSIEASENADNPMTQGQIPLLVCDVWEHAYYLDHESDRAEYVKQFESVINWNFIRLNLERELPSLQRTKRPAGERTTAAEFKNARASN